MYKVGDRVKIASATDQDGFKWTSLNDLVGFVGKIVTLEPADAKVEIKFAGVKFNLIARTSCLEPEQDSTKGTLNAPGLEPIDVIEAFPDLSYNLKNALKYILRKKDKDKDLEKAINYLHRELTGKWLYENHSVYGKGEK